MDESNATQTKDRTLHVSENYKKTHKLVYTQLLQPPTGYRLERALATTYSLDLTMLMASALALYFQKEADDGMQSERYDVLAALEEAKDTLRIHFQRGHLKAPLKFNQLFHLLEPCLIEEKPSEGNFHPKVWLLRFRHARSQSIRYRLICTSRNLTDSQDWDLSVFTDGDYDPQAASSNPQPDLIRFVQALSQAEPDFYAPFVTELPYVNFEPPKDFEAMEFVAFPSSDPFPKEMFEHLLIMSPFLVEKRLLELSQRATSSHKSFLFSTKLALDGIPSEVLKKYQCFCINPLYVDALSQWEEGLVDGANESPLASGDEKPAMNLHAKLYAIATKNELVHLIGSANCTQAAFTHNTEALIRLQAPRTSKRLAIPTLARTFYEEHDKKHSSSQTFFIPYECEREAVNQKDPIQEEAECLLKTVLRGLFRLEVKPDKSNQYILELSCQNVMPTLSPGWEISLCPLTLNNPRQLAELPMSFGPLGLKDITAYVLLEIKYQNNVQIKCLLKLDLEGAESLLLARHQAVIQSLLNNIPKLLSYLSTVAEHGQLPSLLIGGRDSQHQHFGETGLFGIVDDSVPLYEKLLSMASQNPEQLRRVETVMQSVLQHPEIPDEDKTEFQAFWEPFHLLLQEQGV